MPRSWDRILTERDHEHLEARGKKAPFGFGSKPALLVIDDYYSVVGEKPEPLLESIKRWPGSCGLEGWEALYRTQELLASARANNVPVLYVHGLENFVPWGRRPRRESPLSPEQQEIANKIVDEVAPLPGELVLQKAGASAFFGTPIVGYLNYLGIDTLICCGETTSGCVRASVVDAAMYRYAVGVVEECCFDRTEASHLINLFDMDQKYGDVIDLAAACSYFDRTGGASTAPVVKELVTA